MSVGDAQSQSGLGFLTVLEHEQLGLTGGYLILNLAGRPLEFHCTAPLKPNRAQQILFGPTLAPYLYGEQIGQALLSKGSACPLAVCTNVPQALCVREHVALPVALVLSEAVAEESNGAEPNAEQDQAGRFFFRLDAAHDARENLTSFALGINRLAVMANFAEDRQAVCERLANLTSFDLLEPFERIREAVEEAHRGSRA